MYKIVFNGAGFHDKRIAGITRHAYEIILELDKIVKPDSVILFVPRNEFDFSSLNNIKVIRISRLTHENKVLSKVLGFLWKYVLFSGYCFFNKAVTVNLFLAWKWYSFDVMSIYDCTTELFYKDYGYKHGKTELIIKKSRESLISKQIKHTKQCRLILTDSKSAKKDIALYYGVPADKIADIYCGWQHFSRVGEDEGILDRFNLRGKEFFLSLGSRMPHKNIRWVTAAAGKHPDYSFVITGYKDFEDTTFEGKIYANTIFTGYLKDEEIKTLMRYCKAFIQPSLYEGFGIPPLEAMSTGADCIVSDIPVFREIYKDSVWYVDPEDYDNIDLDEIMSRPKESNDVVLSEYSWEKSAKKLYEILRELAD